MVRFEKAFNGFEAVGNAFDLAFSGLYEIENRMNELYCPGYIIPGWGSIIIRSFFNSVLIVWYLQDSII